MKRHMWAIADGIVAGLAYVGLFSLAGNPLPFDALIASAVGVAVLSSIFRYFKHHRESRA